MKFLTFFILLGVIGHTLAGGFSQCGPLVQPFTSLLQAVESLLDFVQDKVNSEKKII